MEVIIEKESHRKIVPFLSMIFRVAGCYDFLSNLKKKVSWNKEQIVRYLNMEQSNA